MQCAPHNSYGAALAELISTDGSHLARPCEIPSQRDSCSVLLQEPGTSGRMSFKSWTRCVNDVYKRNTAI